MSSKRIFSGLFASLTSSLLAMVLAGCGLSITDKPPADLDPNFKAGEKAQCLSEVLPTMSHFVEGNANAPAVEQTWECFRVALNLYGNFVRGREDDRYAAREIATFFELYFLKDVKISDRLLSEIMKLKQILVGGEADTLTRDELNRLLTVAQEFKIISLKLLPYMRVYSFNWKVSKISPFENDVHYFEDANLAIQEAAKDLAKIIARNDKSYNISNVVVLMDEMAKLYNSDWPFIADLQRVMPLVYKLKRTLAGGDEQSVASKEWRRFVLLGARGYIQFLRYYYFIKTNEEAGGGPEVIYIAKSIDDLFSYLGDMVSEKPQGVFTRAELLEILIALTQFVPEVRVSDPFLIESMKLKKLFFGGNIDHFTPQDFIRARAKVVMFRSLTEKLLLYLPLYAFSWNSQLGNYADNQRYFKEADSNLVDVFKGLGSLIEESYELKDLNSFAVEFEKLYPSDGKDFSFVTAVKKYLPLVISGKQVLFSDDNSIVNKNQWGPLMILSGQALGRSLYYYYFLSAENISIEHGDGLKSFNSFVFDTSKVLDSVLEKRPKQTIQFSDISKLTVAFETAEMLPKKIPAKMMDELAKVAFQKVLIRPERRLNGDLPTGLSLEATQVIREEFQLWTEAQSFFGDEVFKIIPPGGALAGGEILRFFPPGSDLTVMKAEMKAILESPLGRSLDPQGRLVIAAKDYPYNLASIDSMNLSRILARQVIRSYAMDIKRIKNYTGIVASEAEQLYKDLKPVLVAIDAVEEKNTTFASSRFLEANLFTPRANGDDKVSFIELTDVIIDVLSGTKLNNLVVQQLTNADPKIGCPLVHDKVDRKDKIQIGCLADVYYRDLAMIFSSMPNMRDYLVKLPRCRKLSLLPWITDSKLRASASPREKDSVREDNIDVYVQACEDSFDAIFTNMVKAVGYKAEKEGIINFEDISLVPHIMQYIEEMIQRFDQNHNGVLSEAEAMRAYPVFKQTLKEVSGYSDDKTLKGLLAYFMVKGRPPETLFEKAYFYLVFRNQEGSWNINVTRSRLASILAYISDAMATQKTAIIGDDPTGETKRTPRQRKP